MILKSHCYKCDKQNVTNIVTNHNHLGALLALLDRLLDTDNLPILKGHQRLHLMMKI